MTEFLQIRKLWLVNYGQKKNECFSNELFEEKEEAINFACEEVKFNKNYINSIYQVWGTEREENEKSIFGLCFGSWDEGLGEELRDSVEGLHSGDEVTATEIEIINKHGYAADEELLKAIPADKRDKEFSFWIDEINGLHVDLSGKLSSEEGWEYQDHDFEIYEEDKVYYGYCNLEDLAEFYHEGYTLGGIEK